jgi:hypothetical protein
MLLRIDTEFGKSACAGQDSMFERTDRLVIRLHAIAEFLTHRAQMTGEDIQAFVQLYRQPTNFGGVLRQRGLLPAIRDRLQ